MTTRKVVSKAICMAVLIAVVALLNVMTRARPLLSFTVTNTADSGPDSLRQAILDANANPGLDSITFNIPAAGVQTIRPLSPLPSVTDPVIIDGYTQPGSSPNTLPGGDDASLLIELDGTLAGSTDGLVITAGKSVVQGLVINRFNGSGIRLEANGSNQIGGNFIGIDASGGVALGNGLDGITIYDASNNTVGGTKASMRNVISANRDNGVQILGVAATGNRVQGNFIGTKANGLSPLGNLWHGVALDFLASNNQIGGTSRPAGNRIAYNGRHGVCVASGADNAVLSNSIFANAGLGLDLGNDGVTPNDPCDPDAGANNLQNAPQLSFLWGSGGGVTIEVRLNSTAGTTCRIEFFSSPTGDPSGFGEGQQLLTSTTVTTGGSCLTIFNVSFGPGVIPPGHVVTATMTDPAGNTSEFSNFVITP